MSTSVFRAAVISVEANALSTFLDLLYLWKMRGEMADFCGVREEDQDENGGYK